jgi:hypothetical protein
MVSPVRFFVVGFNREAGSGRLAVWLPTFTFAMTFKDEGSKRLRAPSVMQMN